MLPNSRTRRRYWHLDGRPGVFKRPTPSIHGKGGGGYNNNSEIEGNSEPTTSNTPLQRILHQSHSPNNTSTSRSDTQHPKNNAPNIRQPDDNTRNPDIYQSTTDPETMESQHYANEAREYSRNAQSSTLLHPGSTVNNAQHISPMEDNTARCNHHGQHGDTRSMSPHEKCGPLHPHGTNTQPRDESPTRARMAHSGPNWRYAQTHPPEYQVFASGSNDGTIHRREDSSQRQLLHSMPPHHGTNSRLPTQLTQQPPPISQHHNGPLQRGSTEHRYPVRVPVYSTRKTADVEFGWDERQLPPPHLKALEHLQSSPLSRLWSCQWREPLPSETGNKSSYFSREANRKAIQYLQPNGGAGCPSGEDIQRALPTLAEWQKAKFPIRPKPVRECKWRRIIEDAQSRHLDTNLALEYTRYLHDTTAYPQLALPPHIVHNTALSKDEERQLSARWVRIEYKDIQGSIYTFKVVEPHKERCRVVHACHINELCTDRANQPPSYKLRTFEEINQILANASLVTQFDAVSMYNQFRLENVNKYFAFKTRQGVYAALGDLPMGFTYACGIAQSLSLLITFTDNTSMIIKVDVVVHLDNYLFAFTYPNEPTTTEFEDELKQVVLKTIGDFFARTLHADLQLNEISREEIIEYQKMTDNHKFARILAMSPKKFTFLGVDYNLTTRTRSAAEKSWKKLDTLIKVTFPEGRFNPYNTPRHLAMLQGTMGWIRRVCNIRHTDFNTARNTAELAYALWIRSDLWDKPLEKVAFMFQDIFETYKIILSHRSTAIYPSLPLTTSSIICISDASATGWGAYLCRRQSNKYEIQMVKGEWPKINGRPNPIYESSTVAEPRAILEILKNVEIPATTTHITFVTDHSPLVHAAESIQARCHSYHQTLSQLIKEQWKFNFLFLAGKHNVADGPSRGSTREVTREAIEKVAAGAGMGVAKALQIPSKELPCVIGFDM